MIVQVIGNYGVGKTSFMLQCGYQPKDIVFINDDVKEPAMFDYKSYVNLTRETIGLRQIQFYEHCRKMINDLPQGGILIWDTFQRFEKSIHSYVEANPTVMREKYSPKGDIRGSEIWIEAFNLESQILSILDSKFEIVMLSSHIKKKSENGILVDGAFVPDQRKPISKNSDLRIWLTPDFNSQVPNGLVLKNIIKQTITENGIEGQKVLPDKIPNCSWETINNYIENPIGNRSPNPNEIPDEFEYSMINDTLTPEQNRIYQKNIELRLKEAGIVELQAAQQRENEIEEMKELVKGLKSPIDKLNFLKSKNLDYQLPLIGELAQW